MTNTTNATPTKINSFLVQITPIMEDGKHAPTVTAMHVGVEEGRLQVLNTDYPVSPITDPLARTIRRKLAPKSGNQLFVS